MNQTETLWRDLKHEDKIQSGDRYQLDRLGPWWTVGKKSEIIGHRVDASPYFTWQRPVPSPTWISLDAALRRRDRDIAAELDKAGVASGNENGSYSLIERIQWLVTKLDESRDRETRLREDKGKMTQEHGELLDLWDALSEELGVAGDEDYHRAPIEHAQALQKQLNTANRETERLFDLVRYARAELHQANLITDEEYAELCQEGATGEHKGSRKRLESYDELRQQSASRDREMEELRKEMISWRSLAQEMTPGGSEFMTQESVRQHYREFKDSAHEARKDRSKLQHRLAAAEAALRTERDLVRVKDAHIKTLQADIPTAEAELTVKQLLNFLRAVPNNASWFATIADIEEIIPAVLDAAKEQKK